MKVSYFDTYVQRKDGETMHFDIIVPEGISHDQVLGYGKEYLASKEQEGQIINATNCQFCHVEDPGPNIREAIGRKGYYIFEMSGCD